MNKIRCAAEKLTLRSLGFILIPFVLFFVIVSNIVLPVLGLFLSLPLIILNVVFLTAPKSKTCELLLS
jgi:hypothetical protein